MVSWKGHGRHSRFQKDGGLIDFAQFGSEFKPMLPIKPFPGCPDILFPGPFVQSVRDEMVGMMILGTSVCVYGVQAMSFERFVCYTARPMLHSFQSRLIGEQKVI